MKSPAHAPFPGVAHHVLIVLDGTEADDALVTLGAYSVAITGGRVSLLLLPREPLPPALWLQVVGFGVHPAHAAETYLYTVVEHMRSAGARVDRIRIGDQAETASIIDFLRGSGVDVVAASSPPPIAPADLTRLVDATGVQLVVLPAAA